MHWPSSGWSGKNWTLSPRPTPILPPPALQPDWTQGLAPSLPLPSSSRWTVTEPWSRLRARACRLIRPNTAVPCLTGAKRQGSSPRTRGFFFLLFCFFTHHLRALKSQLDSPRKHGETAVSATLKSIDEFKDYKKSLAGWRLTHQVITMPGTRLGGAKLRRSAYFICSNPTESTEKSGSWNFLFCFCLVFKLSSSRLISLICANCWLQFRDGIHIASTRADSAEKTNGSNHDNQRSSRSF